MYLFCENKVTTLFIKRKIFLNVNLKEIQLNKCILL